MSFFKSLFQKKEPSFDFLPSIMGLNVEGCFEVDELFLKLIVSQLTIDECKPTQFINAVGTVDLDGTYIFRFYTDDDGFLQVVAEGGKSVENIVDVKLYHFYDTLDIADQAQWDELLFKKMGNDTYTLNDKEYKRVWTSSGDYHNPVPMQERTFDKTSKSINDFDKTDQFTMLFERDLGDENYESLFLSAEEKVDEYGNFSRCLVISTGITLTPSQLKVIG